MHPIAVVASLGTILAWGSAAIFDKIAMTHFTSPWSAVTLRMGLAWFIVTAYTVPAGGLREWFTVPRHAIWALIISGLLGSLAGQLSYYLAVKYAEASRVVPITATYPLVAFVLGLLVLNETLTVAKVAGLVFTVAGVVLLSLPSR